MNTFGKNLRLTTFGESHGPAMGGVIDGFPAGFKIDFKQLQEDIDKRKPGASTLVTQRKETDRPEFLSGISTEGLTLGTPIGFIIRNSDHRSSDYEEMARIYRPNHADYTYDTKYGIRDFRGGGRASARETVNWVVAGSIALQWLNHQNIFIDSVLSAVGSISFSEKIKESLIRHPETTLSLEVPEDIKEAFNREILIAKNSGDSIGGKITCLIKGIPAGKGDPVFRKLHASLAGAMMSINAAKAFEYGLGEEASKLPGSRSADTFYYFENKIRTKTNYSGGIQGGISNGMPIFFTVTFKATPTVMKELETIDKSGNQVIFKAKGRHDPCVALRAVPIVKSLAALVIADFLL